MGGQVASVGAGSEIGEGRFVAAFGEQRGEHILGGPVAGVGAGSELGEGGFVGAGCEKTDEDDLGVLVVGVGVGDGAEEVYGGGERPSGLGAVRRCSRGCRAGLGGW